MEDYGGGREATEGLAPEEAAALEELNNPTDEFLRERYQMGREAEDFLRSPIGKYLLNRAEQEIKEGLRAILDTAADPRDDLKLQEAIRKMRVADKFMLWVGEVIAGGLESNATLVELIQQSGGSEVIRQ